MNYTSIRSFARTITVQLQVTLCILLAVSCISFSLSSCGSSATQAQKKEQTNDQTNAQTMAVLSPELARCKQLFEQNCQRCHELPQPEAHSEDKWGRVMPVMAVKAKINVSIRDSITKYILASRMTTR